ncbi:hypothetical protein PAHAL_3G026200 [Panicum hallii]|jgi:hypothetical protein|uniref:RING-type domain-containing protein n=1 Tax=Panicum hallii TaxID=206008 RepID=A0A2S3H5H7_9POAL|nr:E3 ubiquitin-protein ligase RING1-like [Panicum hallii]PAN15857.2 hypothetical protein PAHAL_3G026200 [Panicum hallii]
MLVRFGSHGARTVHGHRQELGRGGTRRRLVWLRPRLHESTELFDQRSDDRDLVEQIVHRQVHEAMMLHLLARALGLDIETIIACLQEGANGGGGFGAVPASAAAVAALEKHTFHATEGCGGESECAICFEDFEDGEEVSVMPCAHGHEYHTTCITKSLGRSNMCSLCRHELPTGVDGH